MHPHPKTTPTQNELYPVLQYIRKHYYADRPKDYHRHHRDILRALTWPAAWLDKQALTITAEDYNRLLLKKLHQIKQHGDPNHYRAYFPKYLMKVLQDHCHHHKEALYQKLKHASYTIDWIARGIEQNNQHQQTGTLAAAHQLLHQKQRTTKKASNQMTLGL
jgi:anaerobic ribonucleoside-triphosphate reductase